MTEILFVHGALVRDGAWWWRPVADLVQRELRVGSRAIELPSCGEADLPSGAGTLSDDAAALRRALDGAEGDALVVGHSYGGTVVAEGADHPAARHLLYISSYLPDVGLAQADIMRDEPNPVAVAPGVDGTVSVDGYTSETFAARFLQDVPDPQVHLEAWDRVTAQSGAALGSPTTHAAWQGRPSTYLVCTDDRSTSIELQRKHAARATESVDLPTGHHPFLSRPDLVAQQIAQILRSHF
jgi:pimeloyl-ACP methyl ester carboxylesterase